MIMQAIRPSLVLLALFTVILGVIYPTISSVLILSFFHPAAEGSLIKGRDGDIKGSMLIGQNFAEPRHFWGRLSATAPAYNAAASSGSNLGVNNPTLLGNVQARVDALKAADPDNAAPIPVDLVTASGSGLDPHISPAAAAYQIKRVARARGLAEETVAKLVADHTEGRQFGILGEPVVNVLALNLDLDSQLNK